MPNLELCSARLNSVYANGKVYEAALDDGCVYVGSTCEELKQG